MLSWGGSWCSLLRLWLAVESTLESNDFIAENNIESKIFKRPSVLFKTLLTLIYFFRHFAFGYAGRFPDKAD